MISKIITRYGRGMVLDFGLFPNSCLFCATGVWSSSQETGAIHAATGCLGHVTTRGGAAGKRHRRTDTTDTPTLFGRRASVLGSARAASLTPRMKALVKEIQTKNKQGVGASVKSDIADAMALRSRLYSRNQ